MSKFTEEQIKLAQETQRKYGVPASVTLAQFALESGYGTSTLARNANNYFGITGSYQGNSYRLSGRDWRQYTSMAESFEDHGRLLSKPLYADKTAGAANVGEYIDRMSETYAPSSDGNNNYAGKLKQIISENNLTQYDSGAINALPGTYENVGFFESKGQDILGVVIKTIAIIIVVVLAFIFFMSAFDIKIPSKGDLIGEVI